MNFEHPKMPENGNKDKEEKFDLEKLRKESPGIGEHDVTVPDSEGKYDLIGRGIKHGLKAGEIEHRRLSKEFREDREQSSLDKLGKEEQEKILKEAEEFARNSKDLIGISAKEWNAEFSKIMQKKAEELALNKLKEKI